MDLFIWCTHELTQSRKFGRRAQLGIPTKTGIRNRHEVLTQDAQAWARIGHVGIVVA